MLATRLRGANPEGRMPLMEHIRELRSRLLKSLLAIGAFMTVGWYYFEPIWAFMRKPFCAVPQANTLGKCNLTANGLFQPFMIHMKIAFIAGVILAAPFWLYQLWAFVAPGLHRKEKRWSYAFLATAVPLFGAGAALAFMSLEKGLRLLLSFASSKDDILALITVDNYLSFVLMMLLVFGVAFELPLFMVMLNVAGVLPHALVKKHRRMIIFLVFLFAAIATPSPDPFVMTVLAVPVTLLVLFAEFLMFLNDRRKIARGESFEGLSDDEVSPLDLEDQSESPRSPS